MVFPELVKVSCFGVGCEKTFIILVGVLIAQLEFNYRSIYSALKKTIITN